MANILIVYATREGQTEKIARRISRTLKAEGHVVEMVDADHDPAPPRLDRFQAILVGGPVHAMGYPRSIVRFAREHWHLLTEVPSAFFSVSLAVVSKTSDGRAQTLEIVEKFMQKTGWRPAKVELIAGALQYSKYNFLIRFVMRRIAAKEGGETDTARDYEYTNWEEVDRFAREMAREAIRRAVEPRREPALA